MEVQSYPSLVIPSIVTFLHVLFICINYYIIYLFAKSCGFSGFSKLEWGFLFVVKFSTHPVI